MSALHLASVEALARAIGARDQTLESSRQASDTHVRRVQKLAVSLAQAAGMSENEVKGVEVAALLHDIGKLAVPEHILTKPGRLTADEFQAIRLHPSVGAEIIKAVPFPYPVAPLIESHHERWDGSGYPLGLAGDGHPAGGAHPRDRGLLRRAHRRSSVSQGHHRARGHGASSRARPGARSTRTWSRSSW